MCRLTALLADRRPLGKNSMRAFAEMSISSAVENLNRASPSPPTRHMGRVDWRTSAGSLVTGSLVRRQSGRLPHWPFFGGMGGVGGSQLMGTKTLEPDTEFPEAPSPTLAKKDASLSAPAIRLFSTRACSTWFPVAASNPAVTSMPLIPEAGVTPSVGIWSTCLQ